MANEIVAVFIDIGKTFIPTITRAINDNLEEKKRERLKELSDQRTRETLKALKETKNGKNFTGKMERYVSKMPIFEFREGESVDDVGNRMWTQGHDLIIQLPDTATPEEVHVLARSIVKSFKNHPCMECRENIIELMKKYPLVDSDTKEELEREFFDIHNEVNRHVGNEFFSKEDYKKQYGRDIE